jgi:hypothetical protein
MLLVFMIVEWLMSAIFVLAQVPVAQSHNPDELIRAALANYSAREAQVKDYEYLERQSKTVKGNITRVTTVTPYEIMIIDGRQYRRRLANDQPVSPEQEEQERLEKEAKERQQAHDIIEDRAQNGIDVSESAIAGAATPTVSLADIPELFNVRIKKQTILDGRKTYILEATPKQRPSTEIPNDPRTFKIEIWIDETDNQIMRVKATAIHPGALGHPPYVRANPEDYPNAKEVEKTVYDGWERYAQGTVITMEWRKINEEAWLPTRVHIQGTFLEPTYVSPLELNRMVGDGSIEIPFEYDTVYSEYKKFRVEHRILPANTH